MHARQLSPDHLVNSPDALEGGSCRGWRPPQSNEFDSLWGPDSILPPHLLAVWGAWVAQSVELPTSAQVMISPSASSSPTSGSVWTAQSLELLGILCLPLWPFPAHALSLPVSKINIKKKSLLAV